MTSAPILIIQISRNCLNSDARDINVGIVEWREDKIHAHKPSGIEPRKGEEGKRQSVDITTSKPQTKNGISSVAGPPDDFAAPPSETDHKNFST
uniref:Uncharacterized protein n=1 Tax=Megaselia scalaris TaxID=36166 RepID=T1GC24_MEGSC